MSTSTVNGVLEKRKAELMESCKETCRQMGVDDDRLAVDEALVMGQMVIEIDDIEERLRQQVATAMQVLKLKMYVQLTFSFLYECEINEEEISF